MCIHILVRFRGLLIKWKKEYDFNVMYENIVVCWCHLYSHDCSIELQILSVAKNRAIMFQYENYQCRNVINQCLVGCVHRKK